jgi:hypothetical protein
LGDDDATDSDPVWVDNPSGSPAGSFPVISVTTGSAGDNNHTYDFGFVLAPTAAGVRVHGQVRSARSNGIRNVLVNLVEANGSVHTTQTGTFGYYSFDDIEAGQSVILTVMAKRYTFRNPSRVVLVKDEVANADFVADDPSAASPQFWISPPFEELNTKKQKERPLEP